MSWILFTILAALAWSIVNILDKHVISQEVKDPLLATTVYGFTLFILSFIPLFITRVNLSKTIVFTAILIGGIYTCAGWLYYKAMKKEEASRFIPMLAALTPLFVLIMAFFFLGERFALIKYLGIVLVISGSLLISLKKGAHKIILSSAFLIAIISGILYATRDIIIKYVTLNIDIMSILFWVGVGAGIVATIILAFHHPHLRKKAKEGIKHFILINILSAVGFLFYALAISKGPVSLVSAMMQFTPIFVFLGSIALGFFSPKFLKEKINRWAIIQKSIAIALVIIGAIIIIQ